MKRERNTLLKRVLYSLKQVPKQGLVYRNFSRKLVIIWCYRQANGVAKAIPEESLSSSARAARFGQTGGSSAGQTRINLEDNELRGKTDGGCAC
jgi:hypothetical protein